MLLARTGLVALALAVAAVLALFVGLRMAFLFLIGVGFGLTLEGLRFGFAGPWKALIARRDARGVLASSSPSPHRGRRAGRCSPARAGRAGGARTRRSARA